MPYVRQPEELIPGRPLFFATATILGGVANGVLVESHEGRPTKVEGNPEHPATLGACDPFSQASVLQLYDPDRSQALSFHGEIRSWPTFGAALRSALRSQQASSGGGIRILTETITSPTMANQLAAIQKIYPASKWHQWEPAGPHSARAAAVQSFGQPIHTHYNLTPANVVVSLDSDFLASGPGSLRYARQFAARHRGEEGSPAMNRLYVVEPMPTPTGTKADHRLPLRASEIEEFAWGLAANLGVIIGPKTGDNHDVYKWLGPIARDLEANKRASLVIAGEHQPPIVHALAYLINEKLGNVGTTLFYTDPIEANPVDQATSLQDLVKDLDAGAVELLLILGGNPAFNAPVEFGIRDRLRKAKLSIRLGQHADETSELCHWQIPETHYLETWGDARAFDGTVTIQQPLLEPLYGGVSAYQLLQMLTEQAEKSPYEIVKGYWATQHPASDFEDWWRRTVHDGIVPNSALQTKTLTVRDDALASPAGGFLARDPGDPGRPFAPGLLAAGHLAPHRRDHRRPRDELPPRCRPVRVPVPRRRRQGHEHRRDRRRQDAGRRRRPEVGRPDRHGQREARRPGRHLHGDLGLQGQARDAARAAGTAPGRPRSRHYTVAGRRVDLQRKTQRSRVCEVSRLSH